MDARSRVTAGMAVLGVTTTAAVAAWGWSVRPEKLGAWVFMAAFFPASWAYVESMQVRGADPATGRAVMTLHRAVIAWGALTVSLKTASPLALSTGLIDATWALAAARLAGVSVGLFFIHFGNVLPKLQSPWGVADQPFDWQRVHRFVGWVLLLAGAATVAVWLSLPFERARFWGRAVVAIAAVLAVGRKFLSLATHRPPHPASGVP